MGIKSHTSCPRREIRQVYAEGPQTLSRRSIISLGVGPLRSLAVEIDTRLPFEVRRSGDMENGVGALLDATQWFEAALDDHPGVHESRRMQTIDRDARSFERFGEVESEHHLRELALAVGSHAVVDAREHHVGE